MTDFRKFEYVNTPYIPNKNIDIRPLTNHGYFNDYLSKDSYLYNYLPKTTLSKMFAEENKKRETVTESKMKNRNRSVIVKGSEKEKEEDLISEYPNQNYKNTRQPFRNKSENRGMDNLEADVVNSNLIQENTIKKKISIPIKLIKKRINLPSNSARFSDDYNYRVQEVKEKLSSTVDKFTQNHTVYKNHPYDGFESFHVPRIDSNQNPRLKNRTNTPAVNYTKRIAKSVCSLRTNRDNSSIEKNEEEKLESENNKLKQIFFAQTNNNFLSKNNLPKIGRITTQPKIKIAIAGIGNSKDLGERYNPYSFIGVSKNWLGRNYHGGLFQH